MMSRKPHRRPRRSPSGTWSKPIRRPSAQSKWSKRTVSPVLTISCSRAMPALGRPAGGRRLGQISVGDRGADELLGALRELQQRARLLVDDRDPLELVEHQDPVGRAGDERLELRGEPPALVLGGAGAGDVAADDLDRDRAAGAEAQRRLALDPDPAAVAGAQADLDDRRARLVRAGVGERGAQVGTSSGCVSARHRRPITSSWRSPSAALKDGLAYSISPWPSNIHTRSGESSTSVAMRAARAALASASVICV